MQYEVARLTVTKVIASGNSRGAQVLLCSIRKLNAEPFIAVAKIFDPLYYPSVTDIACSPIEVVDLADGHYSREAAAYEFLQSIGQAGSFAPDYFGSWTFSLPISYEGQERQRPVRLILIEYLAGACMRDLFVENAPGQIDASHLSEQYRLRTLAMLLEGVVRQHHAGLSQRDLAPRNVIVLPHPDDESPDDAGPERVVLIDYNISLVWELSTCGKQPFQLAELPQNPMQQYWENSLIDFGGWTPPDWYRNPRLRQEWLVREFGGGRAVLYEPVEEELEFSAAGTSLTHGLGGAQLQRSSSAHGLNPGPAADNASAHGSSAKKTKKKKPFEVAQAPLMTEDDKPSHKPGLFYEAVQKAIKEGKIKGY